MINDKEIISAWDYVGAICFVAILILLILI
jgi:hypothetical protein